MTPSLSWFVRVRLRRSLAFLASLLAVGCLPLSLHGQELPTKSGAEDLEAEAKKLMEELPPLTTEGEVEAPVPPNEDSAAAVERTKTGLENAKRKQARWEKLARQGILSRAEAEACVVEVADAQARHERARLAFMRKQLTDVQQRATAGSADAALVESAESAALAAKETCSAAEKQARQARLDFARTNLDRFRKLFGAGLVSRVQLQRAESTVKKIEADGQEQPTLGTP